MNKKKIAIIVISTLCFAVGLNFFAYALDLDSLLFGSFSIILFLAITFTLVMLYLRSQFQLIRKDARNTSQNLNDLNKACQVLIKLGEKTCLVENLLVTNSKEIADLKTELAAWSSDVKNIAFVSQESKSEIANIELRVRKLSNISKRSFESLEKALEQSLMQLTLNNENCIISRESILEILSPLERRLINRLGTKTAVDLIKNRVERFEARTLGALEEVSLNLSDIKIDPDYSEIAKGI